MSVIRVPHNWRPRPYQLRSWCAWERGIKREILIWHRRAGKDDVAMHKIAVAAHPPPKDAMPNQRVANYWHCLPMYEQARKAIWEAVNPHTGKRRIDEAFPLELRKRTDNSGMTIEFLSGSSYRIVGSDNPDSLVGAPPFGIVFSEWALSNPSAWGYLAPILAENNGWASFITTPRGRNHAKTMLDLAQNDPLWFAEVLTVKETGFSIELVEQQRKEYHSIFGVEAGDALIEQEYWCSFEAAILGAYYGKEMAQAEREQRIGVVEPWPDCPVHTAWDLGVDDAMAIWFWQAVPSEKGKGQVRVIDYVEGHGYGIAHYAQLIKTKAQDRGYQRGKDFVPHDAKVREMTSSGTDGKAKQRVEVMRECGLNPVLIPDHKVMDGIQAVRQMLPRCHWDETRCGEGLECLRQYRTEWDDDLKAFKKTPLHDWASHGADAKRTMAMAYREMVVPAPKPEDHRMAVNAGGGVNQVTLDDLWAMRSRENRQSARRI